MPTTSPIVRYHLPQSFFDSDLWAGYKARWDAKDTEGTKVFVDDQLFRNQQRILQLLDSLQKQGIQNMATIAELQAQVAANTTIVESAITLIHGLATKIEENKTDPAALQAMADELRAEDAKLAEAVATSPA